MSLEKYAGKVAVVTGASAGIGKSIAEHLVKKGVIVAGIARRVERVEELSKQLKNEKGSLHAFQCDLTKADQIASTFKSIITNLGPIYILVNNAGVYHVAGTIDGNLDKWRSMLDTNVMALAICTREAISDMKTNKTKGHIVNINSYAGQEILDIPGMEFYTTTKHAVTALTETVRLEINREKLPIKITSISPGYVKTEIQEIAYGKERAKKIAETTRYMSPEDITESVLYVLGTPDHVNVKEITILVQGQIG
ncbi:farnesol dehydrogenase-like [Anthonomus grandis grandis]|uniref:farnesol dehydrogenase-like n=1 Tax=Anthonomus grandis grandis TaxID=2921223 RepID=UPI0021665E23|nr:farnesol dehydrogenase-like [Anthonomus grandis grandis]